MNIKDFEAELKKEYDFRLERRNEYLTKYIEATVLEIKQNEPYITLPESALIEGEAER